MIVEVVGGNREDYGCDGNSQGRLKWIGWINVVLHYNGKQVGGMP